MPSAPNESREARIYLAIWRKAYREFTGPKVYVPLRVNASTYSMALAMKKGLYRAIKPYRENLAIDDELREAAEVLVVSVPATAKANDRPNTPHFLELKPRSTLSELELEMERLGLASSELLSPMEAALSKELDDLIQRDDKPGGGFSLPSRSTPFYTRED